MKLYNENHERVDKRFFTKKSTVFMANKHRNHIESYYEAKKLADRLRSYVYNVFDINDNVVGYAVPK